MKRVALLLCLALAGTVFCGVAAGAESRYDEKSLIEAAQSMRRAGAVQFNFADIELLLFVRFMSELLQENIVVPPGFTGKASVISPRVSTLEEARQIMFSVLRLNGYIAEDLGGYIKISPDRR